MPRKVRKMGYHVSTKIRSYSGIDNADQMKTVLKNWNDTTPIIAVFVWVDGSGWVKKDPIQFMGGQ
jgi:hypothetical protein